MVIDSLINGKVLEDGQQFNRQVEWTKTIAHRANINLSLIHILTLPTIYSV